METRAHHILIGAFTLLVVAGALLFALWLAKASISSQYDYYDIVFSQAVTGLSQGGTVQYNGIRVGEVDQLKLDPNNPSKVLVRIRVAADTPVKVDTRAKLGLVGLTGVSFIQLTGGSPGTPLLKPPGSDRIPRIQADDSALSQLLDGSQDIVSKLNDIITRASELLSSDNVHHIAQTLAHLDEATGAVAAQHEDLGVLVHELAGASTRLNEALAQSQQLLRTGNQLLAKNGEPLMDNATQAMVALNQAATRLDALLRGNQASLDSGLAELGPTLRELRKTLESLQALTKRIDNNPAGYLLGGDRPREYTPQ